MNIKLENTNTLETFLTCVCFSLRGFLRAGILTGHKLQFGQDVCVSVCVCVCICTMCVLCLCVCVYVCVSVPAYRSCSLAFLSTTFKQSGAKEREVMTKRGREREREREREGEREGEREVAQPLSISHKGELVSLSFLKASLLFKSHSRMQMPFRPRV